MQNFQQPGEVVTMAAPYDRTSGQGALIGHLFGVAVSTVLNGVVGEFKTTGVFTLAKTSAQAWTVGALLYWDDTNKLVTNSSNSAANFLIGCAYAAAANPSATGIVRLNGTASA